MHPISLENIFKFRTFLAFSKKMFRTLLFSNSGDNHNQIADKYRSLQTTRPYVLYDPRVRNIGNISFAFLAATRTINILLSKLFENSTD